MFALENRVIMAYKMQNNTDRHIKCDNERQYKLKLRNEVCWLVEEKQARLK